MAKSADELMCGCGHSKRFHSIIGCTHREGKEQNYRQCTCPVKFTDKEMFQ